MRGTWWRDRLYVSRSRCVTTRGTVTTYLVQEPPFFHVRQLRSVRSSHAQYFSTDAPDQCCRGLSVRIAHKTCLSCGWLFAGCSQSVHSSANALLLPLTIRHHLCTQCS
jgi:hypothetical protein